MVAKQRTQEPLNKWAGTKLLMVTEDRLTFTDQSLKASTKMEANMATSDPVFAMDIIITPF